MKSLVLVLLAVIGVSHHQSYGQKLFFTRNGHVDFFSSTPVENIKANNEKVTSVVNITTGEMEFSVLIIAFEFKKALMQEHFNENYVESHKFPRSTFKGKVTNIDEVDLSQDGTHVLRVSGALTIHGVTKSVEAEARAVVGNGRIKAEAAFPVRVKDFDIAIPRLVVNNIAEVVDVKVSLNLKPM